MDYKNSLNLPRTEFPMQANLVQREPQRLAQWQSSDLYGQLMAARAESPRFVLHDAAERGVAPGRGAAARDDLRPPGSVAREFRPCDPAAEGIVERHAVEQHE